MSMVINGVEIPPGIHVKRDAKHPNHYHLIMFHRGYCEGGHRYALPIEGSIPSDLLKIAIEKMRTKFVRQIVDCKTCMGATDAEFQRQIDAGVPWDEQCVPLVPESIPVAPQPVRPIVFREFL